MRADTEKSNCSHYRHSLGGGNPEFIALIPDSLFQGNDDDDFITL